MKCKICGKKDCYEHCKNMPDGKHVVAPHSLVQAEGVELVADVSCKSCGQSGSVAILNSDIAWG